MIAKTEEKVEKPASHVGLNRRLTIQDYEHRN